MKIDSSTITMSSERTYFNYQSQESSSWSTTKEKAATLEFSDESKTLAEQLQEKMKEEKKNQEREEQQSFRDLLASRSDKTGETQFGAERVKSSAEIKLEVLRRMLEALRGGRTDHLAALKKEYLDRNNAASQASRVPAKGEMPLQTDLGRNSTIWTRTTVKSSFFLETEHTAFQAQGVVKTADGRELSFQATLEMSRAYCEKSESLIREDYLVTDPLVINLDTNIGSVSDQKFLFDLDSDGNMEKISFAGKGSGFLALDKNGDGVINDGRELFGTKSGDGFRDLECYDLDHNGWIDENDEIFNNLKIWTKDNNGVDRLISLKEAGVGAIYLGRSETEFALKDSVSNKTNGVIRSSGIYLKENGGAGTIQQIDLAI